MTSQKPSMPGPFQIALIAIVWFVTLPVSIPMAAVMSLYDRHRMEKCANAFECVSCQQILGKAALERADQSWQAYMSSRMREGMRIRVVRKLWAVCVCGLEYDYNEKENAFFISRGADA